MAGSGSGSMWTCSRWQCLSMYPRAPASWLIPDSTRYSTAVRENIHSSDGATLCPAMVRTGETKARSDRAPSVIPLEKRRRDEVWQLRPARPRATRKQDTPSLRFAPRQSLAVDLHPCLRLLPDTCTLLCLCLTPRFAAFSHHNKHCFVLCLCDASLTVSQPPLTCDWHPLPMHASPHAAFSAVYRTGTYVARIRPRQLVPTGQRPSRAYEYAQNTRP